MSLGWGHVLTCCVLPPAKIMSWKYASYRCFLFAYCLLNMGRGRPWGDAKPDFTSHSTRAASQIRFLSAFHTDSSSAQKWKTNRKQCPSQTSQKRPFSEKWEYHLYKITPAIDRNCVYRDKQKTRRSIKTLKIKLSIYNVQLIIIIIWKEYSVELDINIFLLLLFSQATLPTLLITYHFGLNTCF